MQINEELYSKLKSVYGNLVDEELRLEDESIELAKAKFLHSLNLDKINEDCSRSGTTSTFLKQSMPVLTTAIQEWLDSADNGKCGRRHILAEVVRSLGADTLAYLTFKNVFSALVRRVSLPNLSSRLGLVVEKELRYKMVVDSMTDNERRAFQVGLNKRIGMAYKEAYIKARESFLNDEKRLKKWNRFDESKKCSIGLKLLEIFCQSTGLAHFYLCRDDKGKTDYYLEIDNDVLQYISVNDEFLASHCVLYRPMVIPPKDWDSPFNGGYYMEFKNPTPFIRLRNKDAKRLYESVDMPNVYKAVNAIQSTAWQINNKVLEVAQEIVNWQHIPEGLDMPSVHPQEPPMRPEEADTNEEVQLEWRKRMVHYYQHENVRKGRYLRLHSIMSLAN